MLGNNYLLWENDRFMIKTPFNPHTPYEEGLHLILISKLPFAAAWKNPEVAGEAFALASRACAVMEAAGIAPWFNLQANGNWGLLPGNQTFFHIHIYGRNKTASWGKPITLPEAPGTYEHEPMPETDRATLIELFKKLSQA